MTPYYPRFLKTFLNFIYIYNSRDATIIQFIDLFTSLFSGCVIFISLGFMAKTANLSIDQVVSQGK